MYINCFLHYSFIMSILEMKSYSYSSTPLLYIYLLFNCLVQKEMLPYIRPTSKMDWWNIYVLAQHSCFLTTVA